jgi:DNA sulfur modification protein DndE
VNPVQCEDVVIRNVNILNLWSAQNGDGLDIGSCHNVLIYDCVVDAGDDGICLKPGAVSKEKNWPVACENIVIANCTVYRGHGGFVIGSESYGGVRNISVKNCTFIGTDIGLRFKSSRGRGGLVENVYIDGIQMKDIAHEAILFDMYYEDSKPEAGESRNFMPVNDRTPRFQNFFIKNIVCNGAEQAISIQGLPEKFARDIEISDVTISARRAISCIDAESITFKNVKIISSEGPIFSMDNTKKITIDHFVYPAETKLFMKVVGKESSEIKILGTDLSQAKTGFELGKEVNPKVIINQ